MANKEVVWVTTQFFFAVFLVATQDIAVDGWAITILSPEFRKYGSTCQAIGQNIGFFVSYTIFLAFSSADFCNSYIRSIPEEGGLLSLGGYMYFWGIGFILVSLLLFLKKERIHTERGKFQRLSTYFSCFLSPILPYCPFHLFFSSSFVSF